MVKREKMGVLCNGARLVFPKFASLPRGRRKTPPPEWAKRQKTPKSGAKGGKKGAVSCDLYPSR